MKPGRWLGLGCGYHLLLASQGALRTRDFALLSVLIVALAAAIVATIFWVSHSAFGTPFGEAVVSIAVTVAVGVLSTLYVTVYWSERPRKRPRAVSIEASSELREKALATIPDYLQDVVREYGRLAAGPVLDVCTHPRLNEGDGWRLNQLRYYRQEQPVWITPDLSKMYQQFKQANLGPPEKLSLDLTKIMLTKSPSAQDKFHDDEFPLYWSVGLFSEMRFIQVRYGTTPGYEDPPDSVLQYRLELKDPIAQKAELHRFVTDALGGTIRFPGSLSINCFIITRDRHLVVYQRGQDVRYCPGKWCLTVDENVRYEEDFKLGGDFVWNCIRRGVQEELVGTSTRVEEIIDPTQVRVLSFFLEGNLPGENLAVYVPISLDADELATLWSNRQDPGDTMRLRCVPVADLTWEHLTREAEYTEGWSWKTAFHLILLRFYLKLDPLQALP